MITLTDLNNIAERDYGTPPQNTDLDVANIDWQEMEKIAKKYSGLQTMLLVGNGGSVNTFRGIYKALHNASAPKLIIVDTNEPEAIESIDKSINPNDTLLLSISKSGETSSQLEVTKYFEHIPNKLFITSKEGELRKIGKQWGVDILNHRDISGRFSGLTEIALMPALLCGFDAREIHSVLSITPIKQEVSQAAWSFANILWDLENKGNATLIIATYSDRLSDFGLFIQQMIHETIDKKDMGIDVMPLVAPEFQHHTAQRILGGRKNTTILFVFNATESGNNHLLQGWGAEYKGTQAAFTNDGIPNATLEVIEINESTIGRYIYFWQLVAYYSATLRDLNPFDQPEVEKIKDLAAQFRNNM